MSSRAKKYPGVGSGKYPRQLLLLPELDWGKIASLYSVGWGFKRLAHHYSVAPSAMRIAIGNHGLLRPYSERTVTARAVANAEKRGCNHGWRARELEAENAVWRKHDRWWKQSRLRSAALKSYYANHDQNKKAQAESARRRYHLQKREPWHIARAAARMQLARIARQARRRVKCRHTIDYLGCTYDVAARHIAAQLPPQWSWENYGTLWEIDHIVQLSDGDVTDQMHIARVCHYTNLRPLSVSSNRTRPKGAYTKRIMSINPTPVTKAIFEMPAA